jgi:hypothetical protein
MNRGKLAIVLMIGLACALGLLSIVYHRWVSHGVLAWLGGDRSRLVADASTVTAYKVEPGRPSTAEDESMELNRQSYHIIATQDVSKAFGLDHVRHGLLDDQNFVWPARSAGANDDWNYVLVFDDGRLRTDMLFDFKNRRLGRAGNDTVLTIDPVASGWEDFFKETFSRRR